MFLKRSSKHAQDFASSPGLSWVAKSKTTGIKLELISNILDHLFIEKGLRGGISYIWKRFRESNNKYMNNYDLAKESEFKAHLDANNLYGWGMSR